MIRVSQLIEQGESTLNRHRRAVFFQRIFLWIFILGLVFFLYGQHRVFARQDNGISLSAQAGFDGYCKEATWIPVRVTVANSGPDLNARVQVSYGTSNTDKAITGTDISLPNTSQKEFFLYFYPPRFLRSLNVSLVVEDKTLAKVDLRLTCLTGDDLLVGLLAGDPSAYNVLNEVKTSNGSVHLAQLQPANLPDQPQGWEGLDALIIAGEDVGRLTSKQHQALRSWVASGGKLLVTGGLNWQNTSSGLEDILPVSPDATYKVSSLSALKAYSNSPFSSTTPGILAVGQLRPDAEVLVEQEGYPLIAKRQIGLGNVYYLSMDPSLQPLAGWGGMQDLYSYLFGFSAPEPVWSENHWDNYSINRALSTLPELGLPPIYSICGWLAIYIVVIGPVNYLVLRRLKRGELAWLTTPAIVIVFTCIAYFFGFLYRGAKPILNRLTVVEAWEGSTQARVRGMVGLYSPTRAKYTMETNDQFLFYPFGTNTLQSGEGWQTVQKGTDTLLPDVQVEIGGMQVVSLEGTVPAMTFSHNLVLDVNSNLPVLTGTITNTSGFTLKNAILVTPGALKVLGDLAPSSSQDVRVSLVAGKSGPQIYTLDPWNTLGTTYYRNTDEVSVRQSALLQAIMNTNASASKKLWGIYLMGWVDEPLLPVGLQGRQFETIDTTFYVTMLSPSISIEAGTISLPPGMFVWDASVDNVSPYHTDSSYLPKGGYSIRFRPAVPIHFNQVRSLTFHIGSSADPKEVQASLWDFENERWDQLEIRSWGDKDILEPWRYVSPEGEIRLKIEGDQNTWIEIEPSNFTLVVEQ